jgi:RNA polymerase sigma-70 factor (ECF subfamily)
LAAGSTAGAGNVQRDAERIYDEYLAAAARAGDRAAWERLVLRWQPRLFRHAWRLCGHPEQARDLVQEAWIEILRGLRRLDDVAAFPAWALRIVTRRCQRAFRRAGREFHAAEVSDLPDEIAAPEHESGEFAVDLGKVLALMQSLPAGQRAALALFHLDHLSVAEIAIALDVPPGTVKTRLMHARLKLRAHLEGNPNAQDG